ncbi:hypothetical protein AAC387_Pa03g1451 [Persea americana]
MLELCKALLRRRDQNCPRRRQFSALHGFKQKPVRSSKVRGRSSEHASVWEKRSQKPVRSSEHWESSSEQVSGCEHSGKPDGGSSEQSSGWVLSSEPIIARANLMLSDF